MNTKEILHSFAYPGAAFRGKPFWSWNGELRGEELVRQAHIMKEMGLGGYFMQIDVIDADVLRRAQEDPDRYKTLSVRVSGWNARFVTLNREWQEMIIERTEQKIQ